LNLYAKNLICTCAESLRPLQVLHHDNGGDDNCVCVCVCVRVCLCWEKPMKRWRRFSIKLKLETFTKTCESFTFKFTFRSHSFIIGLTWYMHFWSYLERNRLNIHGSEHLFLHTWRMKHALCPVQFVRKFCVFEITVQQGTAFTFANSCVQLTTSL
jgi:hypothetical protein